MAHGAWLGGGGGGFAFLGGKVRGGHTVEYCIVSKLAVVIAKQSTFKRPTASGRTHYYIRGPKYDVSSPQLLSSAKRQC